MRRWFAVLVIMPLALTACPSAPGLTLMSYNVENLFDDVHNGKEYVEFDPARGKWNTELFRVRVESIAEVIRKSVAGGPDVILLQEVENENALQTLVDRGLQGMGYAYRVFVPKKNVSANVALISRLPVTRVGSYAVSPWGANSPMRDVVEAEITVSGHTLHVFVNHWKSKIGGTKATEASRRESASVLSSRLREILAQDPNADIVAAGDLNEDIDEYSQAGKKYQTALMPDTEALSGGAPAQSIFLSADARGLGAQGDRCELYEPWFEMAPERRGSYAYQGKWFTVDHILLSAGLLDTKGFTYRWGSFSAVRLPFLLTPNGLPRSWTGLTGARGYSDHLPVLIGIDVRN